MKAWQKHRLGDVVDEGGGSIQTGPFGSQLHASDYVAEGIPCIMPANMKNNRVDVSGIARISEHDANRLKRHIVKTGDIVYSRRGDVTQKALIRESENGFFCGTGCLLLRPGKKIDPAFLTYYLSTKTYQSWIASQAVGATMPNLNTGILNRVSFCAPDKDDQERIASVLTALDAKIELNNRINEELEGMAKLLYDYWFVQFDFPMTAAQAAALGKPHLTGHPYRASGGKMSYNETLKRDIPEGWEARKLNEVGTFKNGINYSPQDVGDMMAHIINVRNMSSSSFFLETSSLDEILLIGKSVKNYLVTEKSVLIARSGIPGATRLIQNQKDNTIYCGFIICFEPYLLKDRNLVFFYMKMIEKAMTNNSAGTVLKNVSQDTLKALCIPFPGNNGGDDTLEKFNTIIEPIFNELGTLHQQNQELTQLRDWLLPMLMNGQVTVGPNEH